MTRRGEAGYALVAAVASIGVFASLALAVVAATHGSIEDASAELAQLRASAAADAGMAMALHGMLSGRTGAATGATWSPDGVARSLRFGDTRLRIRIEDERGKVPVSGLDELHATRLLEQAGLSGDRLLIARDSLLDWTDDDDTPRPFGAEAEYYRVAGLRPPNGTVASIDELRVVRGFDPAVIATIKPISTTYVSVATAFDGRFAYPRALAVMDEAGAQGVASINRVRDLAGQRTAIAFADPVNLLGRPFTIVVEAVLPDGARTQRRMVVEMTGSPAQPYVVRAFQ